MVVQPLCRVTTPEPCPGPTESESPDDQNQKDLFKGNFVFCFVLSCFYILRNKCVHIFFLVKTHLWLYSEWTPESWVSGLPQALMSPSQRSRQPGSLRQELGGQASECDRAGLESYLVPQVTLWPWAQERSLIILPTPWLLGGLNEIMLEKSSIAASNTISSHNTFQVFAFCNIQLNRGKNKVTKLKKEVDCFSWNFIVF